MMMMMFILWASRIGLNWNEKRKYWAVLSTWHCTCIYCKEILHIIISCMFYWLERCNNYFLNYFLLKAFENQSIWLEKLKLYGVFNNMQMVLLQRHLFNVKWTVLFTGKTPLRCWLLLTVDQANIMNQPLTVNDWSFKTRDNCLPTLQSFQNIIHFMYVTIDV